LTSIPYIIRDTCNCLRSSLDFSRFLPGEQWTFHVLDPTSSAAPTFDRQLMYRSSGKHGGRPLENTLISEALTVLRTEKNKKADGKSATLINSTE